jgi:hypothetical protein
MSHMLDSLLTPQQRAQAEAIDAAMVNLSGLLAERAVLGTATQALDVSRRAAFEAMCTDAQPIKTTLAQPLQDTLDPEYMQSQIVEAREALRHAETALCGWYGQVNPERARALMNDAMGFLAEE